MAKRKRTARRLPDLEERPQPKGPKPTRAAYQICLWTIIVGLAAQVLMAIIVYPSLPERIPSSWVGSSTPYNTIPSWVVFLLFPGGQIVLLLLAIFSPKDAQRRRVMESGKAVSLILLALLFTALQASAFHVPKMGQSGEPGEFSSGDATWLRVRWASPAEQARRLMLTESQQLPAR